MFILVKYNSNNFDTLSKLSKSFNYIPVALYTLTLSKNKEENKNEIQKLKILVNSTNQEYSALQITLHAMDNTTQGIINQLKQEFDIIIGIGGLNKVNRFFLEQTQIDFLQDPHNSQFKVKFDFIHHFNSGLNHILCKFAQEKKIGLIYSLNFMQKKGIIILKDIGRISQNTQFSNKYSIPIYANFIIEKEKDILSLNQLESIQKQLKLTTKQIRNSQNILEKKIKYNQKKKTKEFISDGLEKIN